MLGDLPSICDSFAFSRWKNSSCLLRQFCMPSRKASTTADVRADGGAVALAEVVTDALLLAEGRPLPVPLAAAAADGGVEGGVETGVFALPPLSR